MPTCFGTTPDYRRLEAVLCGKRFDRVPLYEFFSDTGVQLAAIGDWPMDDPLPTGGDPARDDLMRAQYYLGYDYIPTGVGFGLARRSALQTIDSWGNPRSFLDDHNPAISDWIDFEAYPWPTPDIADYSGIEYHSAHLPEGMKIVANLGGGLLEWGMWLMGAENFCLKIYDDPELILAVLAKINDQQVAVASNAASHSDVMAVAIGDDMGFKTQTFLPPDVLRKLIFPGLKRIADAIHAQGKPFILHSCGCLTEVMDNLIDFVGIEAKHSFEDVIMPIAEAQRRWGDRVALLGGVDMDFLCRAPEKDIRAYVRNIIKKCGEKGGFAVGSGNSIANYVPPASLRAMNEEAIVCQR